MPATLKAAPRVAILGVGGTGGNVAAALLGCGIAEMLLVDFDRVELSNLNRQVLYSEADIGWPKVEAAADRLRGSEPGIIIHALEHRLDSQSAIEEVIRGYDLIVDGIDWPSHDVDRWVNAACFSLAIPYLALSHFPPYGRVGPLYVPGKTACLGCQEIKYRREYPLFDAVVEELRGKGSPTSIVGPVCIYLAGLAAMQIKAFLDGDAPPTLGMSLTIDMRDLRIIREAVEAEPTCSICSAAVTFA
jgi:bacteriocin biosynthesis cyclodehydratase domain-containing protein